MIPVVGLAGGFYVFLQEEIDPRKTQKTHQGLCWLSEIDDSGIFRVYVCFAESRP